ncbi:hypothetical protein D3C78_1858990 [compost metagenome]
MAGRRQASHASLAQHAEGLQCYRGRFGDAGEQAARRGLVLDQLLQGLMSGQVLRPCGAARQDDQIERLGQ